ETGAAGGLPVLLQKMADVIDRSRPVLPDVIVEHLPGDVYEIREAVVEWLRTHAGELEHAGAEAGRLIAHLVIGLVIGALIALHEAQPGEALGPLSGALQERAARFAEAFRRVVFAQVRISAVNTALTGLYLAVI